MSNFKEKLRQTMNVLQEEKVIMKKHKNYYKFADSREEAKQMMVDIIKAGDTSIVDFVWYPEYETVIDWMLGSDKGLLIAGDPGVGKSNIIKLLVPTLFHMIYDMVVRPIDSLKIKENWDIIEKSPVVIIDEVGDERLVSEKYGTKFWIFEDVVKLCEAKSKTLFVTTNFNKNQITARYNPRITDRLDYLVTAFRIQGESMR